MALLSPIFAIYTLLSKITATKAQEPEMFDSSSVSLHLSLKKDYSVSLMASVMLNLISKGKFLFSNKNFKKLSLRYSE